MAEISGGSGGGETERQLRRGCPSPSRVLGVGAGRSNVSLRLFVPVAAPSRGTRSPRAFKSGGPLARLPFLGPRTQTTLRGIPMDVAQLFYRFLFAPHGKIVRADLPEAGNTAFLSVRKVICLSIASPPPAPRSGSLINRCTCSGMTT